MKKFNSMLDSLDESYGMYKTTVRERFPTKLKLSEDFVSAFQQEFQKQTSPIMTEDEDGNEVMSQQARDPKVVLKEFQKALKFLVT